jgi:hypothetical protein
MVDCKLIRHSNTLADKGTPRLNIEYVKGGNFDFVPHVYSNQNLTNGAISWRISDYYPLWAEFNIS